MNCKELALYLHDSCIYSLVVSLCLLAEQKTSLLLQEVLQQYWQTRFSTVMKP